jgi:hypothetical protein
MQNSDGKQETHRRNTIMELWLSYEDSLGIVTSTGSTVLATDDKH